MIRTRIALPIALAFSAPAVAAPQVWGEVDGSFGWEDIHDAASDGAGGALIVGETTGGMVPPSSGSGDIYVARYSALGSIVWEQQLGTEGREFGTGVVSDGAGGCFVASVVFASLDSFPWQQPNVEVTRLDATGQALWSRQFGTTLSELGARVALDGAGGVYLACDTAGSLSAPSLGAEDAWLARLDGAGNILWTMQFGTAQVDRLGDLVEDGAGGVYMAGQTTGDFGAPNAGGYDGWIARIDAAGSTQWIVQQGTPEDDDYERLHLDAPDRLFLVGKTKGSLGGPNAGAEDVIVARYDAAGVRAWVRQFGGVDRDEAFGVTGDGMGGVFAAGMTYGELFGNDLGEIDSWVAQVRENGSLAWGRQYGSEDTDAARGVCASAPGSFIVAGNTEGFLFNQSNLGNSPDLYVAMFEGCSFTEPAAYCSASANSTGVPASLAYGGSASIGLNNLDLLVSDAPPGNLGIVIQATQQGQMPFGDGTLCVSGSVKRLLPPVVISAQGEGTYAVDFEDAGQATSEITAGSTWYFQFWYRDAASMGAGFNLTNGLSATFCP